MGTTIYLSEKKICVPLSTWLLFPAEELYCYKPDSRLCIFYLSFLE